MTQTELSVLSSLPQSMISNLINSKYNATLSRKTLQAFGDWYVQYRRHKAAPTMMNKPVNARLTFHTEKEVPKMKEWFVNHNNPCDRQLEEYVNELNTSIVRLERPKVTVEKLRNWFKNERQKLKRKRDEGGERQQAGDSGSSGEYQSITRSGSRHGKVSDKVTTRSKRKEQTSDSSSSRGNQVFTRSSIFPIVHSVSQGHFVGHQVEGHYHGQQGQGNLNRNHGQGLTTWCDDHVVWREEGLQPKPR